MNKRLNILLFYSQKVLNKANIFISKINILLCITNYLSIQSYSISPIFFQSKMPSKPVYSFNIRSNINSLSLKIKNLDIIGHFKTTNHFK